MIADRGYEEAIKVVDKCSTPDGIFASAGMKGYNSVWTTFLWDLDLQNR